MAEIGIYEAMSTLRAVRRLKPDPIPDEVLRRVLQAAVWAPTGGNRQSWRVIVVRDDQKKLGLKDLYEGPWLSFSKSYRVQIEGMPPEQLAAQERMLKAADHLARNMHLAPAILVFCFDPRGMAITDADLGRPSVVGGGSVYPSIQNALLACRAEGLGCTLTTLLCMKEAEVKKLLDIPDEWYTCAHVPIGYPASKGHGPITRKPIERMAYADTFGTPLA